MKPDYWTRPEPLARSRREHSSALTRFYQQMHNYMNDDLVDTAKEILHDNPEMNPIGAIQLANALMETTHNDSK